MKALIDFDGAAVFAIPVLGGGVHEGMLIEGPQGWGEFSPGPGCGQDETARRLTAAVEPGTVGWPDPVRGRVPVAVAVPFVDPGRAHAMVASSGCSSADVQVGIPGSLSDDIARLEAVRDALGSDGVVRCDAGGRWDIATAVAAIPLLDKASGGLGYVEQPCAAVDDVAEVRRRVDVRVAIRAAVGAPIAEAADVCILSAGPLGGVRRALRVAEMCGIPCTVTTTLVTSVGMAGELALAGVLPQLDFACGLGVIGALEGDVVREGRSLMPVDGYLPVSPMPPGPDPSAVDRFAIIDPTRVAYWRELLRAAQR
ncbi:MAG: enolase C-terminal domain-like protein [Mycobacterium sp.]